MFIIPIMNISHLLPDCQSLNYYQIPSEVTTPPISTFTVSDQYTLQQNYTNTSSRMNIYHNVVVRSITTDDGKRARCPLQGLLNFFKHPLHIIYHTSKQELFFWYFHSFTWYWRSYPLPSRVLILRYTCNQELFSRGFHSFTFSSAIFKFMYKVPVLIGNSVPHPILQDVM